MTESPLADLILSAFCFVAGFVGLVLLICIVVPRHWDGRGKHHDDHWDDPDRSVEVANAIKRLVPLWIPATVSFEFLATAMVWSSTRGIDLGEDDVSGFLMFLSLTFLALFTGFAWPVFYLNRPKLVVAPHYREQPGVFQARWRERRFFKFFETLEWLGWTVLSLALVGIPFLYLAKVLELL
ncbi:hypothetical protein LX16_3253 [Stackebrandtia albiflava]|uniref:Uncharacterized protein n=1 Tax=Stackebrandtia albiflava TaxID=406432 RepID=A0A562V3R4_9ACTN|nr:hypothetical protein [Stackebrandtia albiflava]TWJ12495.1 hypothetical protein LX16_3253 [Stackebrandtia albiflava]